MPTKPKHPCNYPGCPALTHNRFCDTHAVIYARQYEKYERAPETRKFYGGAWRAVRKRFLLEHPLCEDCERRGRLTPAREVHHIIPLRSGGTNEPTNLRALCKPCHSAITIRETTRNNHV
jgi:5-methylcytosine-specific restriction protein A